MNVKGSFGLILHLGNLCSSHGGILLFSHQVTSVGVECVFFHMEVL